MSEKILPLQGRGFCYHLQHVLCMAQYRFGKALKSSLSMISGEEDRTKVVMAGNDSLATKKESLKQ